LLVLSADKKNLTSPLEVDTILAEWIFLQHNHCKNAGYRRITTPRNAEKYAEKPVMDFRNPSENRTYSLNTQTQDPE
jgi:hypothetical protein